MNVSAKNYYLNVYIFYSSSTSSMLVQTDQSRFILSTQRALFFRGQQNLVPTCKFICHKILFFTCTSNSISVYNIRLRGTTERTLSRRPSVCWLIIYTIYIFTHIVRTTIELSKSQSVWIFYFYFGLLSYPTTQEPYCHNL